MANILIIFGANYLIFLIILVAAIYFLKQDMATKKRMAIFGAISLPLIYIIAQIASRFYFDPRPFVAGHFAPLIPHTPDNGFPSDHALLSSAIAMVIFYFNRRMGVVLLIITLLIGISRVLAGVHHPVDILGGIIISVFTSLAIYYLIFPLLIDKFNWTK